ncbi:MAG: hypothetical protein AAGM38_12830 [Pseudomonadota bacterium]
MSGETRQERDDFFIGYLGRLPAAIRGPIWLAAIGLILGFVGGAFALSVGQPDPGMGRVGGGPPLAGVIRAAPYPHIRTAPTAEHPKGRAHLLVTLVKRGVSARAEALDGQVVSAQGFYARRAGHEMLQVQGGGRIQPQEGAAAFETPVEPLGRWRLSGEICDGKCYLGVMRPGVGLAHKACANLCIRGGVPPVLVLEQPVEGSIFVLLASESGGPIETEALYDKVALLLTLEGALERHGDMLVLRTDVAAAEAL